MDMPADFVDFFVENRPRLVGYAYYLTGDWHLAEDIAQETLLAIRHSWDELSTPQYAMWQICRRKAYAQCRKKGASETVCIDDYQQEVEGDFAQRNVLEEASVIVERVDQTRELMRLPLRQREVVFFVNLLGFTIAETARVLGIDESSVRYHRKRAMRSLRVTIGGGSQADDPPRDSRRREGQG